MSSFAKYKDSYHIIEMERADGILEVRLHSDGGPFVWGKYPSAHEEMAEAFGQIAHDPENLVVIITGTGDSFCGPPASKAPFPEGGPARWEQLRANGVALINNILDIPGPVISCLNGPAYRHSQIVLLGDIVLAADGALIQDSAHIPNRTVPGDGVNLIFPLLMGWNRGRYFLLTGQVLDARGLRELGLVNEVMSRRELMPRARELALQLSQQNPLVLRFTRMAMVAPIKELVQQHLSHGLALEGLAGLLESHEGDVK